MTTETQELQAIAVSDIVEKEERQSMQKARSEVHAITRENFDVIRSDLSSTADPVFSDRRILVLGRLAPHCRRGVQCGARDELGC